MTRQISESTDHTEQGRAAMFAIEYTAGIEQERWRAQARCADSSSALVDLFFSE